MKCNVKKEENVSKKDSPLCKLCRHYEYCTIRRYGYVAYCEYFDLEEKKEEEKSQDLPK